MILWTIMPEELVFGPEAYVESYEEIEFAGAKMTVEKIAADQCRIVRIISTDPQDYLRPDLQPGVVLKAKNRYEILT